MKYHSRGILEKIVIALLHLSPVVSNLVHSEEMVINSVVKKLNEER